MEHRSEATFSPILPLYAEVPLRLKSASNGCPTASCSNIPDCAGPKITGSMPEGACSAPKSKIASAAARSPKIFA